MKELTPGQRKAYLYFATGLTLLLGSQNMIQPPTTSTFINSVAYSKIPLAQTWLPAVYLPVLFFYNFLFNAFRENPAIMVTILCLFYSGLYWYVAVNTLLVYDFKTRTEGVLPAAEAWFLYYASNTKSVLFPVMFWSCIADISAQKTENNVPFSRIAYGTLVFGGQLGGILGSLIAGNNAHIGGTPMLIISQAVILLLVPFLIWKGFSLAKAEASRVSGGRVAVLEEAAAAARPAGGAAAGCQTVGKQLYLLVEGLGLIVTHPVLLGIFWIAAAHLVPRVILDFQGSGVVAWKWPAHHGCATPECQHNKQSQTSFFCLLQLGK
jgi:hypothetical protein